tara:strand:- start:895 stop:1077 length:183 start_codon:yes stop_codon:yes gene_type:complete
MPRTKKSATDVKIDQLARDMKEIKEETKSLRADINKGKGAIWILLVIAGLLSSAYNYFNK